jgi:hypothetical protein
MHSSVLISRVLNLNFAMPPENNTNQATSNRSALLLALAGAVLIIIAYFMLRGPSPKQEEAPSITKENVKVTNVNLASAVSPESRLPEGFLRDIPVEFGEIVESYSADYLDKNLTQYVVAYMSSKSVEEKYKEYEQFMMGY